MRELVFGSMPAHATPLTHIASGPWCFFQQEEKFQGWEGDIWHDTPWQMHPIQPPRESGKEHESLSFAQQSIKNIQKPLCASTNAQSFYIPPDPFAFPYNEASQDIENIAQRANGEVLRLIGIIGKKLNKKFCVQYTEKFWTMALGPWLLLVTHALAERQKRILDLIQIFDKEPLVVPILPKECSFSFSSLQEVMTLGIQNRDVNHYFFSRIIEEVAPPHWILKPLHSYNLTDKQTYFSLNNMSQSKKCSIAQEIKNIAKARIQTMLRQLPFPYQKGFGLMTSLVYSLALLGNRNKENCSTNFANYTSTPLQWVFDALPLIEATMPTSISNQKCLPNIPTSRGKLRGMTAAISQDDAYRLQIAAWLEGGGKLFSIQHGANYGNLRVMGGSIFEYMQHAFISWGWEHHEGYAVHSIPLEQPHIPTPQQRKNAITHKKPESLLLVGTEMSSYSYRLKSRPFATAQVNYRKSKIRFLSSLPKEVRDKTLYRAYFPVQGGLADEAYIQRFFPHISLCKGDLSSQILSCRLLVLDHYGTTLLTALASNIPLICFWNPNHWIMEKESEKAIDGLRSAGILYDNALDAAEAIAKVWEHIESWWSSKTIQETRASFVQQYARTQKEKKLFPWVKRLSSL